jgi:excisionase family DNA binding protein
MSQPETKPPAIVPELLDRHQAAELLNISVRLLEYKTKSGELPGFRKLFGTSARWSRSELQRWIEAGCPDERSPQ